MVQKLLKFFDIQIGGRSHLSHLRAILSILMIISCENCLNLNFDVNQFDSSKVTEVFRFLELGLDVSIWWCFVVVFSGFQPMNVVSKVLDIQKALACANPRI